METKIYESSMPEKTGYVVNKAFFGKTSCLKVLLNDKKVCFFHFGLKTDGKYNWKKVKMDDSELGGILNVLIGKKDSVDFVHRYNDNSTQIWVNRSGGNFFIKVKELTKSFNEGEQVVLQVLLRDVIRLMCYGSA